MTDTPPKLVDNRARYDHADALTWLAQNKDAPLSVPTGNVRLGGLVALASHEVGASLEHDHR